MPLSNEHVAMVQAGYTTRVGGLVILSLGLSPSVYKSLVHLSLVI